MSLARAIEDVCADARDADHALVPARMHIFGVVKRGAAHEPARPSLVVHDGRGDALGAQPPAAPMRNVGSAVAGEGELATRFAPRAFEDDAADRLWPARRMRARQDDGGDRALASGRFVARFEIDGGRQTKTLAPARHARELNAGAANAYKPPGPSWPAAPKLMAPARVAPET